MYYLIQSNIYNDPEHHRIFDVMESLQFDYETIELRKGDTDVNVHTNRKDIFVYGSVRLARLAKQQLDWNPGSFYGGNHRFETHSKYYGEHMLNFGAKVFAFEEKVEWREGTEYFIKPYQDAKLFTGKVFTKLKWQDFVRESLKNPKTPLLTGQSMVQLSVPQKLFKEARLWVVGGQIVTGVYYKFHGDQPFEAEVAAEAKDFAKEMLRIYQVADAFVMDVGLTPGGWKIVEINCINSAGFYHANPLPVFRALEMYFS